MCKISLKSKYKSQYFFKCLKASAFKYFSHTLPKTNGIQSKSTIKHKSNSKPGLGLYIGGGLLTFLLIILAA